MRGHNIFLLAKNADTGQYSGFTVLLKMLFKYLAYIR